MTKYLKKKNGKSIVKLFIDHWCAEVNRILHGKKSLQLGENDPIKQLATIWYTKLKKKKSLENLTKCKINKFIHYFYEYTSTPII